MKPCRYLVGENIAPKTAAQGKKLLGKRVRYLQREDIDRSGRGYFFPRAGTVASVQGRNIAIDSPGNYIVYMSNLVEMVLMEEQSDTTSIAT